ncbi:MAG: ferredoxin [Spirochaetes bacterium GWD1_61_31]|nr:MAG: ferredoxin [Spirochaetes bacterium GWB1_60_80]OHD35334.1 MAG: ferredoxin [Spirochaetes bacterium GWC1_61_12]OHD43668.1 MAG: ferredoxin [Spirochaetes bacterium GWD1_61_31]OHD44990.1 MAG: ferredoxin [Spirochaetes bacterium GWE1_60_18]OHD60099.1 MAG: ferredoxin [Spirochaetes bacterium GWF1_60_12]HAP43669.1 ferredoxin [Spirochaetaceae bacterium]
MVNAKINGIPVQVAHGTTILDAAAKMNINIPKLCYNDDLPAWAACGICVVKVEKSPKMLRACCTPIEEGMSIITHDPEIVQVRKTVIELILSNHPDDCLQCPRSGSCELQTLAADFGIREQPFTKRLKGLPVDTSTKTLVLNPEKCIKCGRCVKVCQDMQNVWAIEFLGRGEKTRIAPAADVALADGPCIKCGQCSAHCPVGAIYEMDQTQEVWNALMKSGSEDLTCVVQIAPAVRIALGEEFGLPPGTLITRKIYTALRRLGFDVVFDTNFAADLTILEEGTEFIKRFVEGKGELPLITSCCPAWVDYMQKYYPDMIPNFSTAKSPQQMMGAMIKTYWADQAKVDKKKIFSVSIMPCTAKKHESGRNKDMYSSGERDVDVVLTTRELARMIKQAGIDLVNLPEEDADSPMGPYTGAGTIFGATGGVMEAALRSAYFLVTKEDLKDVNFTGVRGISGIKEARVNIKGTDVRVAVAHQMGNIAEVLDRVRAAKAEGKEVPWHFIEVMACRGGCIGGGGQPYGATDEVRQLRINGIYSDDVKSTFRCSHHNPFITKVYQEFLGEPNGHKAHELLHTHYEKQPIYSK